MKRIFVPLLMTALLLSACGQGLTTNSRPSDSATPVTSQNGNAETANEFRIVTSFYPMYLFALNLAANIPGVSVQNMTQPQTGCLHDYQLAPSDLKSLEQADAFIINGAGMESFLEKISAQYPKLPVLEAAKGITLLKDAEGVDNPHVWVSISGAITEVGNLGEALAQADPAHAAQYRQNTTAYIARLEDLRKRMHASLDPLEKKSIVTFHEAFPYFAEEFKLDIAAVVEREPGTEPGPKELAAIIEQVKSAKVGALFAEPQFAPKSAEVISRETGAKVYSLDPVVTGSNNTPPDAYEKAMELNMNTLLEALK